jgi:hypothetical protein
VRGELYSALFDDAMISMRYARNLAEGQGLVWNPGQAPIEGYTNFLWTLWMAALHLVGLPDAKMPLLVSVSGALILALNVLVVRSIAVRLVPDDPRVAVLAAWLAALCLPLAFWTLVGLEVGLLALLTSLAMLLTLRLVQTRGRGDAWLLAAVLAAAVLVRTDQVVLCAVVLGYLALRLPPGRLAPTLLTVGLVVAVTLAGHTAFRVAYYGDLLPNAYYLKVAGIPAARRLVRGLGSLGVSGVELLYAPIAFAVLALWRGTTEMRRLVALPIAVFLGQCVYSVLVGGDAWEWFPVPNRFLSAGLPALLLTSAVGAWLLASLDLRERRRVVGLLALGLVLAAVIGYGARVVVPGPSSPGSIWGLLTVRWWALGVVLALLLGLAVRLGRSDRPRLLAAGLVLVVAANVVSVRFVAGPGQGAASLSAGLTRLALAVRDSTTPDASMAVVWAGILPYFARRPAVDMLGRSDRAIARMAPRTPGFWPGHNKWDYAHSVGRLRPDLIVQLWSPTPDDLALIQRFGYDRLSSDFFVRRDTVKFDRQAFARAVRR